MKVADPKVYTSVTYTWDSPADRRRATWIWIQDTLVIVSLHAVLALSFATVAYVLKANP